MFNPIQAIRNLWAAKFVQDQYLKLSMADGKPGLTADDFAVAILKVRALDAITGPGSLKAAQLAEWIIVMSGNKISPWTAKLLGYLAYLYAKKKGLIP